MDGIHGWGNRSGAAEPLVQDRYRSQARKPANRRNVERRGLARGLPGPLDPRHFAAAHRSNPAHGENAGCDGPPTVPHDGGSPASPRQGTPPGERRQLRVSQGLRCSTGFRDRRWACHHTELHGGDEQPMLVNFGSFALASAGHSCVLFGGRLMSPELSYRGLAAWTALAATAVAPADSLSAQEISGRALDAANGNPVALAEIELLDSANVRVAATTSNSFGRFVLTAPVAGGHYVVIRRIGYTDMRSPLVMLAGGTRYDIDFEVEPEPFRLEGVEVTVENEKRDHWLRREFRAHPNSIRGFRLIQGARLEEAKGKSDDNTELLRWLYIAVSHGRRVCVLSLFDQCGQLYVDGRRVLNEHIDTYDMESVVAVVTVGRGGAGRGAGGRVYLFTKDFRWERHWGRHE